MEAIAVVTVWILFGTAAAVVASNRGESGCLWFILGMLLGPIGFALAFTGGRQCPDCASRISKQAKICPQCRTSLVAIGKSQKPVDWKNVEPVDWEDVKKTVKKAVRRLLVGFLPLVGLSFLLGGLVGGSVFFRSAGALLLGGCAIVIFYAIRTRKVHFGGSLWAIVVGLVMLSVAVLVVWTNRNYYYPPDSFLSPMWAPGLGATWVVVSVFLVIGGCSILTSRAVDALARPKKKKDPE